jgi:hypothetical protein
MNAVHRIERGRLKEDSEVSYSLLGAHSPDLRGTGSQS